MVSNHFISVYAVRDVLDPVLLNDLDPVLVGDLDLVLVGAQDLGVADDLLEGILDGVPDHIEGPLSKGTVPDVDHTVVLVHSGADIALHAGHLLGQEDLHQGNVTLPGGTLICLI